MRIAICSSCVPFIDGGGRFIVDWLAIKLREQGHDVEVIYLPFVEVLDDILPQFMAYRLLNLESECDRLIAIRPPAHLIPHSKKVVWFIHHLRRFYDLWDTPYRDFADDLKHQALRDAIRRADHASLSEARHVFTNSKVVQDRIKQYNGLSSRVLYPPLLQPETFHSKSYGDEVVYLSRVEHHKRQHLLLEAFRYVRSGARLRISGVSSSGSYVLSLKAKIFSYGLSSKVSFENRWLTEEEKREQLADALAVAYLPLDEDSYGYPSLEGSHAAKAILTTSDSGGVTELVTDRVNGRVVAPDPRALAMAIDELWNNRDLARIWGEQARLRIAELCIDWNHVVQSLLA